MSSIPQDTTTTDAPTIDYRGIYEDACAYLDVEVGDPIPLDELVAQGEAVGWNEREMRDGIGDVVERHDDSIDNPAVTVPPETPDGGASSDPEPHPSGSENTLPAPRSWVESGERWLLWQLAGVRKVPRNPEWGASEELGGYAAAPNKDPRAWHEFETAKRWVDFDDDLGLAYYLVSPEGDEWDDADYSGPVPDDPGPACGLFDFDDVRTDDGEVHPVAAEWLSKCAAVAWSEWSPSGNGAHAYGTFEFPAGVKSAKVPLDDGPWVDVPEGEDPDEFLPELEVYAGKRYTTVTGDRVPDCEVDDVGDLQGVLDALIEAHPDSIVVPDDPVADRQAAADGGETRDLSDDRRKEVAGMETTDDIEDLFDALSALDARDVAEATIVHEWNDGAGTSGDKRAFRPTWGPNSNGTANVVDSRIWDDTGGGGYGGPAVMALIDMGRLSPDTATPRQASGDDWFDALDHLRALGFAIPVFDPDADETESSGYFRADVRALVDEDVGDLFGVEGGDEVLKVASTTRWASPDRRTGGNAVTLAAILNGDLTVADVADGRRYGSLDDVTVLKACARIRDACNVGSTHPPTPALRAIARREGLPLDDGEMCESVREMALNVWWSR